jgi:flagellar motor protein MotB
MKKNKTITMITMLITIAMLSANISTAFAGDDSVEVEPEIKPAAETNNEQGKDSKEGKKEEAKVEKLAEVKEQTQEKEVEPETKPAAQEKNKQEENSKKEEEKKEVKAEVKEQTQEMELEEVEIFQDNENTESFDFKTDKLSENWVIGGDAELTGDGITDKSDDGWLRLTDNESWESGYALYDEALETENGLAFSFDYTSWGGTGADGIAFFLIDGETELEDFNVGGVGGSLGYAPRYKHAEGLSNAYVGIGLDEFGNFSAPTEGREGGPRRVQDSVSVRGSGDGFEGYEYIDGTECLKEGIDTRHADERPDQDGSQYRNVSILFEPIETQFSMTLKIQFGAESELDELFNSLLLPGTLPASVKYGFTATSGGATNYHEIRNVIVDKAVIETVQEEAENQTGDIGSEPEKTTQTEVSIPVTAIKNNNTLIIIPVTGSELYDLNCGVQSRLEIENQAYALLPSLCGYKGSLVLEAVSTLPTSLPAGFSFVNAVSLTIVKNDDLVSTIETGEEIETGFYLDGNLGTENLAILALESGEWVEMDVEILDGIITTTSTSSGLFTLVEK